MQHHCCDVWSNARQLKSINKRKEESRLHRVCSKCYHNKKRHTNVSKGRHLKKNWRRTDEEEEEESTHLKEAQKWVVVVFCAGVSVRSSQSVIISLDSFGAYSWRSSSSFLPHSKTLYLRLTTAANSKTIFKIQIFTEKSHCLPACSLTDTVQSQQSCTRSHSHTSIAERIYLEGNFKLKYTHNILHWIAMHSSDSTF